VLLFIVVTVWLLAWAGVRRVLEKRGGMEAVIAVREGLGRYTPVGGGGR
jgi:hypothetical protein